MGTRQEVLNVILAQLLNKRGVISAPEKILSLQGKRKMPDILVDFLGLRTAIEGEVGGQSTAAQKAIESATRRVEDGVAQIGVAIVYDKALRNFADFKTLPEEIEKSNLEIAVITEAEQTEFVTGTVDDLVEILRHAYNQLIREDVVQSAVNELEFGIDQFDRAISKSEGTIIRIAETLGIREVEKPETNEK